MVGPTVIYNGRVVPKAGFRVYIYDVNLNKRLVNSWEEYEKAISTGLWFATKDAAQKAKAKIKKAD